jgi:hypothetical protein
MRLPIRLNRSGWPNFIGGLFLSYDDPRPLAGDVGALSREAFSVAVSRLQFGITFKTTYADRHKQSNCFLLETYRGSTPVVLDVGASDGTTSLDLIRTLGKSFSRYFVTDLNQVVRCGRDDRGVVYFADQSGKCILRASKRLLVYADATGASMPLRLLSARLLAEFRHVNAWHDVEVIQPDLLRLASVDQRIVIKRYDMFTPWADTKPDVVKIACLLTREYFSDAQIREALRVQCANVAPGGRLLLVSEEDDGRESFSVFRKEAAGMVLEHTHAGGAKATAHVLSLHARSPVDASSGSLRSLVSHLRKAN